MVAAGLIALSLLALGIMLWSALRVGAFATALWLGVMTLLGLIVLGSVLVSSGWAPS